MVIALLIITYFAHEGFLLILANPSHICLLRTDQFSGVPLYIRIIIYIYLKIYFILFMEQNSTTRGNCTYICNWNYIKIYRVTPVACNTQRTSIFAQVRIMSRNIAVDKQNTNFPCHINFFYFVFSI